MHLILNQADWEELLQQAPQTYPHNLVLDDFEIIEGVPENLGRGYDCEIELLPGVWLGFTDWEIHQDWMYKEPAHDHLIQIMVCLSGLLHSDIYPTFGGTCGYFSGSGVAPANVGTYRVGQRLTIVNVEIEPQLLEAFLTDEQRRSDTLKLLFKEDEWKVSFYPTVTLAMRSLAQQLWNAPYQGVAKRMYLQAKVFELLAMHLNLIFGNAEPQYALGLKPETIACLHHAKDILNTRLENPLSLMELAQQVGVSNRTLQRGFRELFGTTVFGYLHNLRMEQAERLLRCRELRVSAVAHAVGYSHLGHFTEAFKRKFGMTPKQWQTGKVNALK